MKNTLKIKCNTSVRHFLVFVLYYKYNICIILHHLIVMTAPYVLEGESLYRFTSEEMWIQKLK